MIVLDTHALIWWLSKPGMLGAKARRAIDAAIDAGEPLRVSSMSVWEIAMLVRAQRLDFAQPADAWLENLEALQMLEFIPVDNRISLRAVNLDNFPHKDPADRIIVATALSLGAALVTADQRIHAYRPVKTIWK